MIGNEDRPEPGRTWKVGALALATGLTVRTLHHYDEIGLLQPSARLAGRHRLYDADDVARLYRIIRLRQLGFPLSQVAQVLAEPHWQLAPAIERHLAEARHRAAAATRLCARLTALAAELAQHDHHPSPPELFAALEEMITMSPTVHDTTGLLMYDDVDAAHDYIVTVFGLATGQTWKSAEGITEYREVRAGHQVIGLHPAGGKAYRSPRTVNGVTGTTVITVDDVDAHYARTLAAGATIVCEPVDRAYGVREYGAQDPEGQIWWFKAPLG